MQTSPFTIYFCFAPTTYRILWNYYFFLLTLRLIQDRDQSSRTQCSVPYAPTKLTVGFSKIQIMLQQKLQCTMSWSLQWFIYQPNPPCEKFWSLYHLEIPSTWGWYCWSYYSISPVYELPNCSSVVGKSCSVCKNPIHTCYADLAYNCANPSCDNVCHLATMCSRFVNPRGTTRAHILSTWFWYFHLHSSPSATTHPLTPPDNSPPRPTPPSLKSLLNQGLSLADTESSKEKCTKCFAVLHSNTVPVRCSICSKGFHQKCSTGPKASTCSNHWKCEKCINLQQNNTSESTNCRLPGTTNSSPSQLLPSSLRNKLKIYQWNTDGTCPKFIELCNQLINSDIDVLAVQELKLWKTDKALFIEGYATIWKDRNIILEGGLLLFICTEIVFEKLHSFEKAGMEILSICFRATKSTWLELYNIYLPNISTQHNSFELL